jgi:hypothetical protein
MNATLPCDERRTLRPPCGSASVKPASRRKAPRIVLCLVVLVLAGYLLFCHGCHGDEDNELFGTLTASPAGASR